MKNLKMYRRKRTRPKKNKENQEDEERKKKKKNPLQQKNTGLLTYHTNKPNAGQFNYTDHKILG